MDRKVFDCRDLPGECTLTISGQAEAVVEAQALHAIAAHGGEDGPDLRRFIRSYLKDEAPTGSSAG